MNHWTRVLPAALGTLAAAVTVAACSSNSSAGASGSTSSTAAASQTSSASAPAGGASGTPTPPSGTVALSETGSTLLYPLFQLWDPAYHAQHSNISITAQGTGSGTGISDASAGSVDIGASDAYLSSGAVQQNPKLENIPLAISAQQINYNLPGLAKGTHLKLDGTVLAKMYLGKITKWNDPAIKALNPGVTLPDTKVVPLHRSDGSGDTFLFTSYLDKQDPTDWGSIGFNTTVAFPNVPGALAEDGNGGMVSGCAATPGCVAYIGISYLDETNSKGLGYAALKNGVGQFEEPTATSIQAEASGFTSQTPANETISLIDGKLTGGYPIVNYEYAIVSTGLSGSKAQATKAFLAWAISSQGGNASSFLGKVHFQPLPAQVVTLSLAQIDKIGS